MVVLIPYLPLPFAPLTGGAAGVVAKTAVAPIERVKLLMQLRGSLSFGGQQVIPYDSNFSWSGWNVAKTVYRKEGFLAFWRGEMKRMLAKYYCSMNTILNSSFVICIWIIHANSHISLF